MQKRSKTKCEIDISCANAHVYLKRWKYTFFIRTGANSDKAQCFYFLKVSGLEIFVFVVFDETFLLQTAKITSYRKFSVIENIGFTEYFIRLYTLT